MSDTRRDFLLRFAATALATASGGCALHSEEAPVEVADMRAMHPVVYGPPPSRRIERAAFVAEIHFGGGRLDLDAAAKLVLESQVAWLKRETDATVVLEGHCDERGTSEYNLALGQRRAEAVKRAMVAAGIAPERVTVISLGKERPRDPGHTEAAWAKNRRVDTILNRP